MNLLFNLVPLQSNCCCVITFFPLMNCKAAMGRKIYWFLFPKEIPKLDPIWGQMCSGVSSRLTPGVSLWTFSARMRFQAWCQTFIFLGTCVVITWRTWTLLNGKQLPQSSTDSLLIWASLRRQMRDENVAHRKQPINITIVLYVVFLVLICYSTLFFLPKWFDCNVQCKLNFYLHIVYGTLSLKMTLACKWLVILVRVTCSTCWQLHSSCLDRVWLFLEFKMWGYYWIRFWTPIHLPLFLAEKQLTIAKVQIVSNHLSSTQYEKQGH